MTLEKYINEYFKPNKERNYIFHEAWHPEKYVLEINGEKYCLGIRSRDLYFYANEVIEQGDNQFIYYKPAYSHYRIRNIKNGIEWEIPKKDTCISLCEQLNQLKNNKENLE